jgi:hypothetical protein
MSGSPKAEARSAHKDVFGSMASLIQSCVYVDAEVFFNLNLIDEVSNARREELKRANDVWNSHCNVHLDDSSKSSKPKVLKRTHIGVSFTDDPATVWMFEDTEETRAARIGTWASDDFRFRNRISIVNTQIGHIFGMEHRERLYKYIHSQSTTPQSP